MGRAEIRKLISKVIALLLSAPRFCAVRATQNPESPGESQTTTCRDRSYVIYNLHWDDVYLKTCFSSNMQSGDSTTMQLLVCYIANYLNVAQSYSEAV